MAETLSIHLRRRSVDTDLPARRRHAGYLFQDHALFPHMTVTANVAFGLHRIPRRDRPQRAAEALTAAGASQLRDHKVRLLSGGEGQRVALARALAPPASAVVTRRTPLRAGHPHPPSAAHRTAPTPARFRHPHPRGHPRPG